MQQLGATNQTRDPKLVLVSHDIPFTAAGFCVREVRVVAASYLTACEDALSSSEMRRIYRA